MHGCYDNLACVEVINIQKSIAEFVRIKTRKYYTDPVKTLEAQYTIQKRFFGRVEGIEPGYWDGNVLASVLGCQINFSEDSHDMIKAPIVNEASDIDKLHVPDPFKDGVMPNVIKAYEFMKERAPLGRPRGPRV